MSEIVRLYERYSKGLPIVKGRRYEMAKWYNGYRFVVMVKNVPILAVRDDGSAQIIREDGAEAYSKLKQHIA